MTKTRILQEITTLYYADIAETEEYTLKDKSLKHSTTYDTQGKKISEWWQDCDPDGGTSLGCCGVSYENGLERIKMRDGLPMGEYTHEQTSENSRIVRYYGEDEQWERKYCGDLLVFEERIEDYGEMGRGQRWCEYEYDDEGRIILEKSAFSGFLINEGELIEESEGNVNGCRYEDYEDYDITEYIYQGGKLYKEIRYNCESPSVEDFFNGEYTKNENDITGYKYIESEEQNSDERVVVIKKYDMSNNTLLNKTICTYDSIYNRIIRKIQLFFGVESMVEETIYQY